MLSTVVICSTDILFLGEILEINKNGMFSRCIVPRPNSAPPAFCIFEYVYFARPDTVFEGKVLSIHISLMLILVVNGHSKIHVKQHNLFKSGEDYPVCHRG